LGTYKIYCDESRQNGNGYKLMGGIWIKEEQGWPFVNEFYNNCDSEINCRPAHMKWNKVTTHETYKHFYRMLINQFFEYANENKIFFKTIVVDNNFDFEHEEYNDGDFETGFYKLYYYMIKTTFKSDHDYHLRIAHRSVGQKTNKISQRERLQDLKRCLNSHAITLTHNPWLSFSNTKPVKSVEPRKANKRLLIQLADILMGAVGYQWNEHHLKSDANEEKVYLSNYIANKLNKNNLIFKSRRTDKPFNIFYMNP